MIFIDTGAFIARYVERDQYHTQAVKYYLQKYADQQVSFTDCVSFVLMKAHDMKDVFTFDRHFGLAGFNIQPS